MVGEGAGLRERIGRGVDGVFVKLPTVETLEAVASAFDFCVIDREHSALGEADALALLRHARAIGFPALLRVLEPDAAAVNRALEAGAAGIQLSGVHTHDEVASARAAMSFPPGGRRSVSTAHAGAGFGSMSVEAYVRQEPEPLLVVQIEDLTTDDPLEEILSAGADVAFVGTADLAAAAGFDGARVAARIVEIAVAAAAAGIPFGGFRLDREDARYRIAHSDVSMFADAVRGVRPPAPVKPWVVTWDELPSEQVRDGVSRRGFGTEACILVMNTCEPGMELRPHSHTFDQIALFTSGHGRYHVGETAHEVGPGSVLMIPAGVTHYIETVDETVENLDVFAPAREDYLHLLAWTNDESGAFESERRSR